jgi:hypothetical protein
MALTFAVRPSSTLPELAQECISLVPQLQSKLAVIQNYTIGTSETAVAHGLGVVPMAALVSPHANVTWWRTKMPDARFVYLAASSSAECDVVVVA